MGVADWFAARIRLFAWATLVANIGIVVTGGAVRLSGSGLGCPTWPRCTEESFTPHGEMTIHTAIEFGNRMLTFVLTAIAIATFVAAWKVARDLGRPDLRRIALVLALGIPAQAVIGGVTVLTDLNPWVVSFHLICSLVIIAIAVHFLRLIYLGTPLPAATAPRPARQLALAVTVVGAVVLYVGTIVTGSGPHAGDAKAPRNGLDPLELSQLHADMVFLYLGLTIGLFFLARALGPGRGGSLALQRAVRVLLVLQFAQGVVGFVQYFTDLPEVLVGIHLLGAAMIAAATSWVYLESREA